MEGIARFLNQVPSPLILLDARDLIAFANQSTCNLLGYRSEELNGRAMEWLIADGCDGLERKKLRERVDSVRRQEEARKEVTLEVVARDVGGVALPLEMRLRPYEEADVRYVLASLHSPAQPSATERWVRRLERIAAMRGQISSLTMRAQSRESLFRGACRILVEVRAFDLSWIAWPVPGSSGIHFAACIGEHAMDLKRMVGQEETMLAGEICRVLSGGRPVWIHDDPSDPLVGVLGELARKAARAWPEGSASGSVSGSVSGSASGIPAGYLVILPIRQDGGVVAALGMHCREKPALGDEERWLLEELADNLSLALDHLEQRERLKQMASCDGLSGLPNRSSFLASVARHLRGARRRGQRLALAYFDLERFRNVNESLGRAGGDEVLRQIAAWLIAETKGEALLARLGADHFAVLMPAIAAQDDLEGLMEGWISRFEAQGFGSKENPLRLGVKVGIALYPEDGGRPWTLLKRAEAALKQAKSNGSRYLFHRRAMSEIPVANFILENQLRRALEREEYVLHYQPKVDLRNGLLSGAEALIRWNDPKSGLAPPNRFIPLLEETGLIIDVGRWTLGRVMEDVRRWRSMGLPRVRIAVNVSATQLRHGQFFSDIEWAVRSYPEAAAGLELEITEGMILEDIEQSTSILREIRAMGVTVALDDFGTGFASLRNLSRLPLDTLKVDKSFVVDLVETSVRESQIRAIVDLAHARRLNVVAEGVEREDQLHLLRALGCDEMQGFLISKPVPREVFESMYLSGEPIWPLSPLDGPAALLSGKLENAWTGVAEKNFSVVNQCQGALRSNVV